MQDSPEKTIKAVYNKWKQGHVKGQMTHPDEEALALFFAGSLSKEENEALKVHIIACERCAEIFSIQAKLQVSEEKQVPQELVAEVKNLVMQKREPLVLEILLQLKDEALELINTTGDVLVGQEFMPAAVLRSRSIKDFKDEVTILKDFKDIRVEVKIENKQGGYFKLSVLAKEKKTQRLIKNLRFTLFKGDKELESYLNDSGKVIFENLALGRYAVEITDIKEKLSSILLEIKT